MFRAAPSQPITPKSGASGRRRYACGSKEAPAAPAFTARLKVVPWCKSKGGLAVSGGSWNHPSANSAQMWAGSSQLQVTGYRLQGFKGPGLNPASFWGFGPRTEGRDVYHRLVARGRDAQSFGTRLLIPIPREAGMAVEAPGFNPANSRRLSIGLQARKCAGAGSVIRLACAEENGNCSGVMARCARTGFVWM